MRKCKTHKRTNWNCHACVFTKADYEPNREQRIALYRRALELLDNAKGYKYYASKVS